MMPIGPLMIEHRRIERMIQVIKKEINRINENKKVDTGKIEIFIDFIQKYADRCHHGKEEGILFRELVKKDLAREHRNTMEELVAEHKWGRETTSQIIAAAQFYEKGERDVITVITDSLSSLADFYPKHIEKEDRRFFIPVMDYFSTEEKNAMLEKGYAFDQKLIHEKYEEIVTQLE